VEIDNLRYERKFRIAGISFQAVRQVVRLLPWGLLPLFPDRQINNIYFDTPAFDTYYENASGAGQRRKFRLRWYGTGDWSGSDCIFEVKQKDLERGKKDRRKIDLRGSLEEIHKIPGIPSSLRAILENSYTRSYFGTANGLFRITIDRNQRFRGLLFRHLRDIPSPFRAWAEDPAIILELKYDPAGDDEIDPILQNLPFRLQKNSKYVQGVQLLYLR